MVGNVRLDSVYAQISVVIPTCNRANLLAECLRACVRNSGGVELEFVVVDGGSSDDTPAVLERLGKEIPSLVWTCGPNGCPGQARNFGATMAKHNTILFIADDIQPLNDDFFRVHSRLHGSYESDRFAVLGKCVWPFRPGFNVNFVMSHIQGHGGEQFGFADLAAYAWLDWRFFYTGNLSIKKAIVADWLIDGFSPAFSLAAFDDREFAYRRTKEPQGFR
ncbi:MAG: glycosyltransferase family 2 protein, partial [Candidatus Binatia bacterium]